jgi:hypothetical protein
MIRTFSLIKNILLSTTILGAFWIFSTLSTGMLYAEYDKLWDYRRLHPDLLPSAQTIQISSVGHMNTYVDFSWIQLIQFIGDNIGNGKYLDFTHTILSNITEIDPYFARAYEFDLLLAPFLYPDRTDQEIATYREKIEDILAHGKRGIGYLCDAKKIETIADLPLNNALWERTDLKNPCVSGMIPYYL